MFDWLVNLWNAWRDPLDVFEDDDTFPDSDNWTNPIPLFHPGHTQPTSPGALDSDLGDLE